VLSKTPFVLLCTIFNADVAYLIDAKKLRKHFDVFKAMTKNKKCFLQC